MNDKLIEIKRCVGLLNNSENGLNKEIHGLNNIIKDINKDRRKTGKLRMLSSVFGFIMSVPGVSAVVGFASGNISMSFAGISLGVGSLMCGATGLVLLWKSTNYSTKEDDLEYELGHTIDKKNAVYSCKENVIKATELLIEEQNKIQDDAYVKVEQQELYSDVIRDNHNICSQVQCAQKVLAPSNNQE